MPPAFAYIIDELLHVDYNDDNKKVYYDEIIHSIIDIEMGDQFIRALCNLIQNLTVDVCISSAISSTVDRARTLSWTSSCTSTM